SERVGLKRDNAEALDNLLRITIEFLQNSSDATSVERQTPHSKHISALEKLKHIFIVLFSETINVSQEYFQVYLRETIDQPNSSQISSSSHTFSSTSTTASTAKGWQKKTSSLFQQEEEKETFLKPRCLSFWCFCAAASTWDIVRKGIHSLIVTSGTLSPLDSLASQLAGNLF
ncbi:hypothetical protein IE077_001564, partial [Cardiosporidium cionae]